MAEAAGGGPMLLLGNLPEDIVALEILVRLPTKALLRCHAVCRAWRRAASARDFLLAHHRRQPSLHLAMGYKHGDLFCSEILAIDHRTAQNIQPVLQLSRDHVEAGSRDGSDIFWVAASCDGLLVLCIDEKRFFMCNPATRQFAGLELQGFDVLALYLHRPTGDYRLLLRSMPGDQTSTDRDLCYVLTLGCHQLPRCIGKHKSALTSMSCTPVLVRGNLLHWTWCYVRHQSRNDMVMTVFDTVAESFRQLRAPMVVDDAFLFEMDGMVGMWSCNEDGTTVNIWVMQDYGREVWSLVRQVNLPMVQIRQHLEGLGTWGVKVTYEAAGDFRVLVDFGRRVLHVDAEGKLLSSSDYDGRILIANLVNLKQSLVRHVFFSRLQGAVNVCHFI